MMAEQKQMMEERVDTGMDGESRREVVGLLNRALADEFTIYTKSLNYHWNVTGPQFVSVHKLLEDHYEELQAVLDEMAERVRAIGGRAVGTMAEFSELTALKEQAGETPEADEMVAELTKDHETVIASLRKALQAVGDRYGDKGTEDLLTGIMEKHEKMAWMLRSLQEGRSVKP